MWEVTQSKGTLYPVLGKVHTHPGRITSYEEAKSINGIGHKTADEVLTLALSFYSYSLIKTYPKIIQIVKTGDLERIIYERKEDVEAYQSFTNYGVGGWYLPKPGLLSFCL